MFPGDDDALFPGDSPGEESGPDDEGGPGAWYDYLQEDMEKSKGKEEVAETSTKKIRAEGNQSFAWGKINQHISASTAPHVYTEKVTNDEEVVSPNVDVQFASKLPESSTGNFGDGHFEAAGLGKIMANEDSTNAVVKTVRLDHSKVHIFIDIEWYVFSFLYKHIGLF